ncbi:MAG: hypothetical protein ACJ76W_00770 [Chloroflexota bacterium]
MAVRVEEVLAVWRAAERALNELPDEAPELPLIRLQVARLRRCHGRLTDENIPTTWQLLTSTHEAISDTRRILAEARGRIDDVSGGLTETERLMSEWLLAEQALNRADDDGPLHQQLLVAADEARERYQAAIDRLDPDLAG